MSNRLQVDQARVKELLAYDETRGLFTWKQQRSGWVKKDTIAGGLHPRTGYSYIRLDGQLLAAHRLAWLYVHGEMPPDEIDHINGLPADNRIANLRLATRAENMRNSRPRKSGLKGTYWLAGRKVWRSTIWKDGKTIFLGHFATAEEAHAAYAKAATELFGQFARVA